MYPILPSFFYLQDSRLEHFLESNHLYLQRFSRISYKIVVMDFVKIQLRKWLWGEGGLRFNTRHTINSNFHTKLLPCGEKGSKIPKKNVLRN